MQNNIAYGIESWFCFTPTENNQNRPGCVYAARNISNLNVYNKHLATGYIELFGKNDGDLFAVFAVVAEHSNHKDWFEYSVGCFVDSENKTEEFLKTFFEKEFSDCIPEGQFVDLFFVNVKLVD